CPKAVATENLLESRRKSSCCHAPRRERCSIPLAKVGSICNVGDVAHLLDERLRGCVLRKNAGEAGRRNAVERKVRVHERRDSAGETADGVELIDDLCCAKSLSRELREARATGEREIVGHLHVLAINQGVEEGNDIQSDSTNRYSQL